MTEPIQQTRLQLAALGDIHITTRSQTKYQSLFTQISKTADILALCGDLTDHGLPEEAEVLKAELQYCTIPKIAVLGNHDYQSEKEEEVKHILRTGNIILLEDEEYIKDDVAFVGIKGFGGGFGKHMLGSFGEKAIKAFVNEALQEAEKLEIQLSKVEHIQKKIALMHYAPITQTLIGESEQIFPFLGTTRLEEVINRFEVTTVFHGHAHFGSPEGKTTTNIPVFNVAYPLLQKYFPQRPYKLIAI